MNEKTWQKAARIPGWLERSEAELLWDLCDGPWCEVGCWQGRSTIVLAETGHPGYAVDWFKGSPEHPDGTDTYDAFTGNLAGYDNVTVIRARYQDAVDLVRSVRLLHLDADHSYRATRLAVALYGGKVRRGGHLVLHDAWPFQGQNAWPGVNQVAIELKADPRWEHVRDAERSAAFRRR